MDENVFIEAVWSFGSTDCCTNILLLCYNIFVTRQQGLFPGLNLVYNTADNKVNNSTSLHTNVMYSIISLFVINNMHQYPSHFRTMHINLVWYIKSNNGSCFILVWMQYEVLRWEVYLYIAKVQTQFGSEEWINYMHIHVLNELNMVCLHTHPPTHTHTHTHTHTVRIMR